MSIQPPAPPPDEALTGVLCQRRLIRCGRATAGFQRTALRRGRPGPPKPDGSRNVPVAAADRPRLVGSRAVQSGSSGPVILAEPADPFRVPAVSFPQRGSDVVGRCVCEGDVEQFLEDAGSDVEQLHAARP